MLRGPSWPASFGTRPPGSEANWWFVSAGFLRPRPAPPVDGWRRRWRWGRAPFTAVVAGWSWIGTATPPQISQPGPRQLLSRAPRSRTAKQAAGSLMPLEGKALAIASAVVKPAPANGEPTLQLPADAKATREGWRPTPAKRLFDALNGQAVRFTIGSAAGGRGERG